MSYTLIKFPADFGSLSGEDLRRSVQLVRDAGMGIAALNESLTKAAEQMRQFSASVGDFAMQAYLEHHDRLPGSERNARLQKKRQTRIAEWFSRWVESNQS